MDETVCVSTLKFIPGLGMPPCTPPPVYFLGGCDLEMVTIRTLLQAAGAEVHDRGLRWGATALAYRSEIASALAAGREAVLIELADDLPAEFPRDRVTWVDHHGPRAGWNEPTSLEQVFGRLGLPPDRWTRDLELVAANDRGHLAGMGRVGATPEEMRLVRLRDRRSQGVTEADEAQAREAVARAAFHFGGRLAVVHLPHSHASAVADFLDPRLGGPGCENLLVLSPGQAVFFGSGRCIDSLRSAFPGGWYGGELPNRGFWGHGTALSEDAVVRLLGCCL